jgi:hypothetical protein
MTRKSCPLCYCTNVNKHGTRRGRQRYQCQGCEATWTGSTRPQRFRNKLWKQYAFEGRSLAWLAKHYGKDDRCIRRELDAYEAFDAIPRTRKVTIVMDVTYFGSWGVLAVIDPYAKTGKAENLVLYWTVIEGTERTVDYDVATDTLEALGYTIQASVIDGRRGVRQMLEAKGIPVQHCQFHQLQTVTQCLTRRPKLNQSQELRAIALTLTKTTKQEFAAKLDAWHDKHGDWLKERYTEPQTKRTRYQHDRTRRAYFSLCRNLPYLFTYQDEALTKQGIKVPNTTNALDGRFGAWKAKLKHHNGCSRTRRTKILRSLFSRLTG